MITLAKDHGAKPPTLADVPSLMRQATAEILRQQAEIRELREILFLINACEATEPKLPDHARARLQAKVKETIRN
jgi:hypothetical protein